MIIASNRPFPNRTEYFEDDLLYMYEIPKIIFFPFWSWKVPNDVLKQSICIGFHTGPVRGGSPIQNLIRQGVTDTYIRVFRMTNKIDHGKDIARLPISLHGSLEEIIIRMTEVMSEYIQKNHRQLSKS